MKEPPFWPFNGYPLPRWLCSLFQHPFLTLPDLSWRDTEYNCHYRCGGCGALYSTDTTKFTSGR